MCRLYGFRSSIPSGVHRSLVAAENALLRQSVRHPDGWGVAHYVDRYPQVIKSDKQALIDGLFTELSAVVTTRTLLAHIRQATVGQVNILNCHPFQHGPWTFAHNGTVAGFGKSEEIRARVLERVAPAFHAHRLGATDSEVCFFLFLSELAQRVADIHAADLPLAACLAALAATVRNLRETADSVAGQPSLLTFVTTNGSLLVGYRHGRDLNYSTHKTRCPERDGCSAYEALRCEAEVRDGSVNHLIVTSEKVAENPNVWSELKDGEFVAVDHAMHFRRGVLMDYGQA